MTYNEAVFSSAVVVHGEVSVTVVPCPRVDYCLQCAITANVVGNKSIPVLFCLVQ